MISAARREIVPLASAVQRFVRELVVLDARGVTVTLVLAIAVALTEGIGLMLLFPLLEVAGIATPDGVNALARSVVGQRWFSTGAASLAVLLMLFSLVMAGRVLLVRWAAMSCTRLQERSLVARRTFLYRVMMGSRWELLATQRDGALSHALTADLENAADAPSHILALVTSGLLALVYLIVAMHVSVTTTAVCAIGGGILLLILRQRRSAARRAAQQLHEITAELFATTAEHVDGLKTMKAYSAEQRGERRFSEQSDAVAVANERCERSFADARALLEVGSVLVLALSIYVAHDLLTLGAGAVVLLLYLFARLTPRLAGMQSAYQQLMLAMPPYMRVVRAIEQCERAAEGMSDASDTEVRLRRALTLRHVAYEYPIPHDILSPQDEAGDQRPASRPAAIRDITLSIAAGSTTAVVGPSGAGKSTLADLVLGLLVVQRGTIAVDDVELTAARARSWRRRVGYVTQEPYLFNDTIRMNLQWAHPEATDADLWAALALASAAEFVRALPEGLETIVGERGRRLSCGERQRLTLARALVRQPELLLLDEATSSIDAEHEYVIQRAIDSLRGRTTILVITHRLASTRQADRIYVMEAGRILEWGTFDELVSAGGRFASMCRTQGILPPRTDTPDLQHTEGSYALPHLTQHLVTR